MKIKKGDTIKFRVACRWGVETASRKVQEVRPFGIVTVRFNGWDCFVIRPHEIISINGEDYDGQTSSPE